MQSFVLAMSLALAVHSGEEAHPVSEPAPKGSDESALRRQHRMLEHLLGARIQLGSGVKDLSPAIETLQRDVLAGLDRTQLAIRALRGFEVFLQFTPGPEPKLVGIWVSPATETEWNIQPARIPGSEASDLERLEARLQGTPAEAQAGLSEAMMHPREELRFQALLLGQQQGLVPSQQDLRTLIGMEGSDTLRLEAFEVLLRHAEAGGEDISPLIQQALTDASPLLQARARELQQATPSSAAEGPNE